MHVKVWEKVPSDLFDAALKETETIEWEKCENRNPFFVRSWSCYLRQHDIRHLDNPTFFQICDTVDCIDTTAREKFSAINILLDWIEQETSAVAIGRVMVTKLGSGGIIKPHIDPGKYFKRYFRFHIPFLTNEKVLFTGPEDSTPVHMPLGYLSQLDNVRMHGVTNESTSDRIHLVADIATNDPKFLFRP